MCRVPKELLPRFLRNGSSAGELAKQAVREAARREQSVQVRSTRRVIRRQVSKVGQQPLVLVGHRFALAGGELWWPTGRPAARAPMASEASAELREVGLGLRALGGRNVWIGPFEC